ncbi:MAG: DUF3179 domain-containing protein [Flavobacteriales bacterium]|nr:DUF3179 domain-containing protein [Flavobacteriales bacterium]
MEDSTAYDLVLSVAHNGDARAYPIELIGYHHQVTDTIGGEPVLVTYCTVCRTGRAWSPEVNGEQETFRLVGMDHFNAMFEDSRTKSWWRQVNGECVAGPLKGQQLAEVRSEQLTLGEFMEHYPNGLVMQADTNFTEEYEGLAGFDEGTINSGLERRDTASWQMKSWVVGVVHKGQARAYDWNELLARWEIEDTLGGDTVVIRARMGGFEIGRRWSYQDTIHDETVLVEEENSGIPAYQEFWHSWRTFHPNTTRYTPKR